MNVLEDKLRTALRETGEEIVPHSVPPLRLRGGERRLRLPRLAARGRWSAWLTPLAAAASVAAVVAASLAISATFHGHSHGPGPAAAARSHGAPAGRPGSTARRAPLLRLALTDVDRTQRGGALDRHRAHPRDNHPAPALPHLHVGERRR